MATCNKCLKPAKIMWFCPCDGNRSPGERIKELEAKVNQLRLAISEAEYAMVGGNDIKEDISWEIADGWFRYIAEQALEISE